MLPRERRGLLTGKVRVSRLPEHLELVDAFAQGRHSRLPAGIGPRGDVHFARLQLERHAREVAHLRQLSQFAAGNTLVNVSHILTTGPRRVFRAHG